MTQEQQPEVDDKKRRGDDTEQRPLIDSIRKTEDNGSAVGGFFSRLGHIGYSLTIANFVKPEEGAAAAIDKLWAAPAQTIFGGLKDTGVKLVTGTAHEKGEALADASLLGLGLYGGYRGI